MDALKAARRWADGWARAWPKGDVEAVVALYSEDVDFRTLPSRPAQPGRQGVREYVSGAFAAEESAECRFGEPVASGGRAAVEWWAYVVEDGEPATLFGVSLLGFADDGRCTKQRDTWFAHPGRVDPPPGWGT